MNVLFYVPLVWWLRTGPYGGRSAARGRHPARAAAASADAWATLREVSGNRTILSMILLAGTSSLLVGNAFQAQMPEFAHDLGHREGGFLLRDTARRRRRGRARCAA